MFLQGNTFAPEKACPDGQSRRRRDFHTKGKRRGKKGDLPVAGAKEDIAEPVKDDSHSTTCFVIPQDNTELSVSFTAIFSDKSGKIAENNFTGKLNYQGDKEGTEKGKWTPGFRYNYTVEINGSKIDPDLKQQVIEFKVDAVEDWTDVDQTPVTPNEVGE